MPLSESQALQFNPAAARRARSGGRLWAGLTPAQFLIAIVSAQFACQLGLLVLGDTSARLLLRTAAYSISLVLLFLVRPAPRKHPATVLGILAIAIVILGALNPGTT